MLVIGTNRPRKVGEVLKRFTTDNQRVLHKQPAMILREVTKEDWLKCCRDSGCAEREIQYTIDKFHTDQTKYYEVSVD